MSFTSVDIRFGEKRYSFDGPDFGIADIDATLELDSLLSELDCGSCSLRSIVNCGVACTGQEEDPAMSPILSQVPTGTMNSPDDEGDEDDEDDDEADDNDDDDDDDDDEVASGGADDEEADDSASERS